MATRFRPKHDAPGAKLKKAYRCKYALRLWQPFGQRWVWWGRVIDEHHAEQTYVSDVSAAVLYPSRRDALAKARQFPSTVAIRIVPVAIMAEWIEEKRP